MQAQPNLPALDDLFAQIELAAQHNLYFLALAGALIIPDICGALDAPDGQASGQRYRDWFDRYVAPAYRWASGKQTLTGEDCYRFRCSLLHQGSTQHVKNTYQRVVFFEPDPTLFLHNCLLAHDVLNLDVRIFCADMVSGARTWHATARQTPIYQQNISRFLTRYPHGLAPYADNIPVIS
jgi:hypothetical protein